MRKALLIASVVTVSALLGLLDAWVHDRDAYSAGLVFGLVGLIPALIGVYALDRGRPRRRR
jgi:hypothetical protein